MITVADTADSMDSQDASYRIFDNQRSKVQLFTPPQGCFPCRRLKVGYMPVVGAVFVCLFQHVSIMCLSIAHLGQLAQKQGGSALPGCCAQVRRTDQRTCNRIKASSTLSHATRHGPNMAQGQAKNTAERFRGAMRHLCRWHRPLCETPAACVASTPYRCPVSARPDERYLAALAA